MGIEWRRSGLYMKGGGLLVSFEIGVGKEGSLEGPMQKKSGVQ